MNTQNIFDKIVDTDYRNRFMMIVVPAVGALISCGMFILNIITEKQLLAWATLLFCILSAATSIIALLARNRIWISQLIFSIIIILLFTYFIIFGGTQGFSPIWILMLPVFGSTLFGARKNTVVCSIMLLIVIFFLWVPFGQSLLQYEYSSSFTLRFPLAYIAYFLIGLLFEFVWQRTYSQLSDTSRRLELSEQRFRIATEQSSNFILEYDFATCTARPVNFSVEDLGLPSECLSFSHTIWKQLIHPDDWLHVAEIFSPHATIPTLNNISLRLKTNTGEYRWYRFSSTAICDEQGHLCRSIFVFHDVQDTVIEAIELKNRAEHDQLTGILNRAAFEDEMNRRLQGSSFPGGVMLLFDLDNFKSINDTYGHYAGDAVLCRFSSALRNCFRDTDLVGRLGGDEFMVWIEGNPLGHGIVNEKISQLHDVMCRFRRSNDENVCLTFSVGAVFCEPGSKCDFSELYKRSDVAMYRAKSQGKNCWAFWEKNETSHIDVNTIG